MADAESWFDKLVSVGSLYLDYDAKKEQAELDAQIAQTEATNSALVEQAKAEVEASSTQQTLMAVGIVAGALVIGIIAFKVIGKW